jgi:hypothetical protein
MKVRLQVVTALSMKTTVFWDISRCSLAKIHRRFRGAYFSIIRAMMEAVSTFEKSNIFYHHKLLNIPEDSHLQVQ